ncbi:hypothetical protein SPD48_19155 [Pseudogracilibacillus sp. SE30717A]|uniref:YkoP family protein n=1 Tax=Pseudogracilibacillus sp. SE30717A TaxID=3098293 RepID=UPI00300E686B
MKFKQYCLTTWSIIDPLYFRFTRLHYVEKATGENTIMRVRLTKYKGRNIVLSDGTRIYKNDILIKIHLHNVELLKQIQGYDNELRRALMIYKTVKESLPFIVRHIQIHDHGNKIKGLIGITMLYKGCHKLGFETYSITNPFYKYFKKAALLPIYLLSSSSMVIKEVPSPVYLFMSKDHLINQYGK